VRPSFMSLPTQILLNLNQKGTDSGRSFLSLVEGEACMRCRRFISDFTSQPSPS